MRTSGFLFFITTLACGVYWWTFSGSPNASAHAPAPPYGVAAASTDRRPLKSDGRRIRPTSESASRRAGSASGGFSPTTTRLAQGHWPDTTDAAAADTAAAPAPAVVQAAAMPDAPLRDPLSIQRVA